MVGGHLLGVQVADLEDVDGDTAAIATTGPLRILYQLEKNVSPWSFPDYIDPVVGAHTIRRVVSYEATLIFA